MPFYPPAGRLRAAEVDVDATAGDVDMLATGGSVLIGSATNSVVLTADGDVELFGGDGVFLRATTQNIELLTDAGSVLVGAAADVAIGAATKISLDGPDVEITQSFVTLDPVNKVRFGVITTTPESTTGTGFGTAITGKLYIDDGNDDVYVNAGDADDLDWQLTTRNIVDRAAGPPEDGVTDGNTDDLYQDTDTNFWYECTDGATDTWALVAEPPMEGSGAPNNTTLGFGAGVYGQGSTLIGVSNFYGIFQQVVADIDHPIWEVVFD